MKETNASFLSPAQKRKAVEQGEAIYYPWAGNADSLKINAADIMGPSSTKYTTRLDLAEGWHEQPESVHKAWITPIFPKDQSSDPVSSDIIFIPDPEQHD
jgi:hypothetical protein